MGREMVRLLKLLELVGAFVVRRLDDLGTIVLLYRDTMRELGHKPRLRHILAQMSHLGVDSLLIVSLTLLFTGVVMTLQTADILIRFCIINDDPGRVRSGRVPDRHGQRCLPSQDPGHG